MTNKDANMNAKEPSAGESSTVPETIYDAAMREGAKGKSIEEQLQAGIPKRADYSRLEDKGPKDDIEAEEQMEAEHFEKKS